METPFNDQFFARNLKYFIIGAALLVAALLGLMGMKIIDTGHRGVKVTFGKVQGSSLPEGIYFYNPFSSSIIELDVRETKVEGTTAAYTKDVQNVQVSYTINYHSDPTQVHTLYETVGRDFAQKLIPQVVLGSLKEIIGQYEAVRLVSDREHANMAITNRIRDALAAKMISVKNFEITNFDFNDAFEHAVEAKVVAIQQAEEAKNKTVKIREEAEQQLISAKAEAESMKIRSQALSQNRSLVQYEAVQKWDGKLPVTITGNGTIPFLNIGQ
jgi:regulator of protease activity HflC (stomatin/prohibitin superfamily)